MISFYLNETRIDLQHFAPELTLLEYLREHAGKTGTREGCASGDCGACTVTVAEADGDQLHYRAVNSCLTLLGSVHGKQIITVEDLSLDSRLHPLQQSFVDEHASQCGFCTPGFVMSAFTLGKSNENHTAEPKRTEVIEALGGNLCRCTGYRPIIDATLNYLEKQEPDQFDRRESETQSLLKRIHSESNGGQSEDGSFAAPRSLDELFSTLVDNDDAFVFAGCTDTGLEITQDVTCPDKVIWLGNIPELQHLEESPTEIRIGAAVTYSQVESVLCNAFPAFRELLARLGSQQIRNCGTIGGNIANASPIGDMPPPLLVLSAELVLQDKNAQRTLPLEEFFLGYKKTALHPGEIISEIRIPKLEKNQRLFIYKVSKRFEDDISTVCAAIVVELEAGTVRDIRIAFGGMAAIPQRAPETEAVLRGSPLTDQAIARASDTLADEFSPITDVRASAAYRLQVAKNLLQRMHLELADSGDITRVHSYG